MKHSKPLSALILIALGLLLSAAQKGSAQEQSPRATIHRKVPLSQKREESPAATQVDTVSPSATTTIQPTAPAVQTPVADNRAEEIQQDRQHEKLKEFNWVPFSTVLQILFTLITTIATVYLAKFTYQLVTVTADLHKATLTGTEVARENMKAAQASAEAAKAQLEFTKTANEQNLNIAKQSTEAAKQSAVASARMVEISKLSLKADRPYILVLGARMGGVHPPTQESPGSAAMTVLGMIQPSPSVLGFLAGYTTGEITLQNFGKGPAIIDHIVAGMMLVNAIPPLRDFGNCRERKPAISVVSADKSFKLFDVSGPAYVLNVEDSSSIRAGTKIFCLLGCLYYRDVFGEKYETGFCWKFSPKAERGLMVGMPYNIDTIIEGPDTHNFNT
jgi:hypothetical protein